MHFNCEYILQSIQSQDSDVAFTVKLLSLMLKRNYVINKFNVNLKNNSVKLKSPDTDLVSEKG